MNPYKFDIQQCMILFMYIFLHFARNRRAGYNVVFRKVKNYGRKFNFIIFNHEYQHAIKYWKKLLLYAPSFDTNKQFISRAYSNSVRWMRMREKVAKARYMHTMALSGSFFIVLSPSMQKNLFYHQLKP